MTNQAGNAWRPMNISTHLHNRTYMGEYYYVQFKEPMPALALVSEELFQSVQEKLRESAKRSRKRTDYNFILTGKLICGICGHSVSGSTSNEKNHYYYCRHCTKENRHCISADYLHHKVSDALSEYLTDEKTEQLASAAYEAYQREQVKDERPALEKELKDVEKKLQNAINAILQGVDALTLKDTITELEERRDKLRNAVLDAPVTMPELKKEYFTFILQKMANEHNENLLDIVVNHIILHEDSVIICINLTDETNLPPLEQILFSVSESDGSYKLLNMGNNQCMEVFGGAAANGTNISTYDETIGFENQKFNFYYINGHYFISPVCTPCLVDMNPDGSHDVATYYYGDDWSSHQTFDITEVPEFISGDINCDLSVSVADAVLLQKWLLGTSNTTLENWKAADLYEDNRLDVFDMIEMRKLIIQNK